MSQEQQEQFEKSFQQAVKVSLGSARAPQALRSRLLESLAAAEPANSPLSEPQLERFETALCGAVERSQSWAPDSLLALRVETAVGAEMGIGDGALSERSVRAALALGGQAANGSRARFLQNLTQAVAASQNAVTTPPQCRTRIEGALAMVSAETARSRAQVVALPTRSRWRRGVAAAASMAAGFALIFGTLVGGADQALAESVRRDHTRCCSALKGSSPGHCASVKDSALGKPPVVAVAPDWILVASKVCETDEGQKIIHNVYLRGGKTVSLHFLPPSGAGHENESAPAHEIGDGEFPVVAWETSGWTVTACSTDLDASALATVVSDAKL